jgi:hypothetical protein
MEEHDVIHVGKSDSTLGARQKYLNQIIPLEKISVF